MDCAWYQDDEVNNWTQQKGCEIRNKKYIMQCTVLHTPLKEQPNAQEWSGQGMLQASELRNA
jgi:hypothetical protein